MAACQLALDGGLFYPTLSGLPVDNVESMNSIIVLNAIVYASGTDTILLLMGYTSDQKVDHIGPT